LRLRVLILTIIVLILISSAPIASSGNSPEAVLVYIEPASLKVRPQEEFTINVMVNPRGVGISAGEIEVRFNHSAFEAVNVSLGNLFGKSPLVLKRSINNTVGLVWCVAARIGSTHPPTPPSSFIKIRFRVRSNAASGKYMIRLSKIGLSDENFRDITSMRTSSSLITIVAPPTTPTTQIIPTTIITQIWYTSTIISTTTQRPAINIFHVIIILGALIIIATLTLLMLSKRRRKPRVVAIR